MTPDVFETAALRRAVLDAWRASPTRLREDANLEEDHARGYYRDRVVVEFAQNAADAATRAGVPGRVTFRLDTTGPRATLQVSNTGAPLDAAGVASLASLRASSKAAGEVGRFGVGFAAVRSVSDDVTLRSTSGGVRFSTALTSAAAREAGLGRGEMPRLAVLRLPFPAAPLAPSPSQAGVATVVELILRDDDAVAAVRDQLDAVGDTLLLALPALEQVEIETVDATGTGRRAVRDVGDRWLVRRAEGTVDAADVEELPAEQRRLTWSVVWALPRVEGGDVPRALHAPTPTDVPLTFPAILLATFPVDPGRRRVLPSAATDRLAAAAGREYAALLGEVARARGADALGLVPGGLPAGDLDAAIREAALDALRTTPLLPRPEAPGRAVLPGDATGTGALTPGDEGGPVAPRDAGGGFVALHDDGGGLVAPRDVVALAAPLGDDEAVARALGTVVVPQRYESILRRLGARVLPLADLLDDLPGAAMLPARWREVYAALAPHVAVPAVRDALAGAPVPLADGRLARGARGLVLPPPRAGDDPASPRVPHDGPPPDEWPSDRPPSDRPPSDRPPLDRLLHDGPLSDRPLRDGPPPDRPLYNGPLCDRPLHDGTPDDRPLRDATPDDRAPTDGPLRDATPDDRSPHHRGDASGGHDANGDLTGVGRHPDQPGGGSYPLDHTPAERSGASHAAEVLGVRIVHPDAAHPVLERVGAVPFEPRTLLADPTVRSAALAAASALLDADADAAAPLAKAGSAAAPFDAADLAASSLADSVADPAGTPLADAADADLAAAPLARPSAAVAPFAVVAASHARALFPAATPFAEPRPADVVAAALDLAAAALDDAPGAALPFWLGELPVATTDGDLAPLRETALPGTWAEDALDALAVVHPDEVARFGAATLTAAGAHATLDVYTVRHAVTPAQDEEPDPADAPDDPDDPATWLASWSEYLEDLAGRWGPDVLVDELEAVADLDAVADDAWPDALRRIAEDPAARRALLARPRPGSGARPGAQPAPSYTAWWLRRRLRAPFALHADLPLLPPAPPETAGLDEAVLRALGAVGSVAEPEPADWADLLDALPPEGEPMPLRDALAVWRGLAALAARLDPRERTTALPHLPDRLPALRADGTVELTDAEGLAVAPAARWVQLGPAFPAPVGVAEALAELLDLPVATTSSQVSGGEERELDARVRALDPRLPARWYHHEHLEVDGVAVRFWIDADGAPHATGTEALAGALADLLGTPHLAPLLAAALRSPVHASALWSVTSWGA